MEDSLRLKFLKQYFEHNRVMPSYREMGQMFGVKSVNSVYKFVNRMERDGFLKRVGKRLAPTDDFLTL